MSTGYDDVAIAIVRGQYDVMGRVALVLASRALGREVGSDPAALAIADTTADDVDRLVAEYSRITGPLGVRMCHAAAVPALERHPEVQVPSFSALG